MTEGTASRRIAAASILIATIYLAIAIPLLPDYGPTFDAVLGEYAYGEYLLEYLRSGDANWLRFEPGRLPFYGEGTHPEWRLTFPLEYVYPVPSILSAVGCDVFARRLGWLHPIDAHHLVAPVSFAALLACLFSFVARRTSKTIALFATLSLALHPHVFGNAMNDIKDTPTLFIVYLAVFAYVRALETGSRRWILVGAAFTGIGLATKINAIWPAAFFSVAWLADQIRTRSPAKEIARRVAATAALATVTVVVAYLACSPQYHVDGVARFLRHAEYATVLSTRAEGRDAFSLEPLLNLARTAPLPLLPLAAIGAIVAWRRGVFRGSVFAMLTMLCVVPVVRPCFPGMRYFNLVRHFLEVYPVLAIFAGIGLGAIVSALARGRGTTWLSPLAAIVVFAPQAYSVARSHPWQSAWFNASVGGLSGAQARHIADADDFWCHSCRTAVRWLNENAESGAVIVDPFAPWMIGSLRRSELREDLAFVENDEGVDLLVANGLLDPNRDRELWDRAKTVIVTYVPQTRRFNQKPGARTRIMEHCERELEPWHVIRGADGGEIVRFYRIDTTR